MRYLADFPDKFESGEITWQIRCIGFGVGHVLDRVNVLRVPYWSIVFPLMLLSAYLLLVGIDEIGGGTLTKETGGGASRRVYF